MESSLSTKGQATIPKAIRDHLHLGPGDRVRFFIHPDGSVVILPALPVASLKGMLPVHGKSASLDDMNAAIASRAVGRRRRKSR